MSCSVSICTFVPVKQVNGVRLNYSGGGAGPEERGARAAGEALLTKLLCMLQSKPLLEERGARAAGEPVEQKPLLTKPLCMLLTKPLCMLLSKPLNMLLAKPRCCR